MAIIYKAMTYKCTKCNRQFNTKFEFDRHNSRKTPCDAGSIHCPECQIPFKTKRACDAHQTLGRCKGKEASVVVEDLQREVEQLNQRLQHQEEMANMTNRATAAAAQQFIVNNNTNIQNVTINIQNLSATNPVGQESLKHLSNMSSDDIRKRLNLVHNPTAFATWCKLLRADDAQPQNHNALLLQEDSEHMACCRDGLWCMDDRQKVLMELLSHDVSRFYTYLGRWENDATAKSFRNEYLLHNIMNKTISGDILGLKPVMDAMSEPLVRLTNRFYVEAKEPEVTQAPEYIRLVRQVDALAESRSRLEQQLAEQNAIILAMRRDLSTMAKQIKQ